jgi:hypothetical protein
MLYTWVAMTHGLEQVQQRVNLSFLAADAVVAV